MAGAGAPKTGGRQAGTPNKLTADVRAMIIAALNAWLLFQTVRGWLA